jgi:L-ascorbate metabolism protein UlaG (beta-lactamase superfamily)
MSGKRLDRRGFLRTATVASAGTALGSTVGAAASAPASAGSVAAGGSKGRAAATFRWLGTAGWRVDIGSRTVLVDPYLSRFDVGLASGAFNPATELTVDAAAIAAHAGNPETVLVTHSHWDHFNDVPHIANTTVGARVFGTMTTYNLALAYGVKAAQLAPVKGGEVFSFGGYTVEVIASLHSRTAAYSIAFPGVRLNQPERPRTISDLPEGDTLAFQITVTNGPTVFFMGASDFVERNLCGLAPDVAMIALPASDATHAYVPRLIDALRRPSIVVPVHWDNIEVPLVNPPRIGPDPKRRLDALIQAVRRVAPRTKIIMPEYLTPYTFA